MKMSPMTEYKPQQLDKKWQRHWASDRAFEVEMDPARRLVLINQAVEVLEREVLVIPLHRQVIPWVTRSNVTLVHRSDNKFAPLWIRIN